jgi:simple sugar transport system permease protein
VLGGAAGGILIAAIAGYLMVYLAVDQIVVGIAILILALGTTSAVYEIVFPVTLGGAGGGTRVSAPSLGTWNIPGLSSLGNAGQIFQQVPLTWLTIGLIPLVWLFLYRTRLGLSLRAAGERPWALEAAGGNVVWLRFLATLIAGAFGGVAGAFLSIGQGHYFFENMTAGRGFIILGVVIFGRRTPWGITGAALVFALAEAFEIELQAVGVHIAYQLLLMIPYVVTILVLVRASGRTSTPAALGQAYVPAQRT